MKEIIMLLIEDDIKMNRLITTLRALKIDLDDYYKHNSTVIFFLLGMSEKEDLFKEYYDLLDGGESLHFSVDLDRKLSKRIFNFLLGYTSKEVHESLIKDS